MRYGARQSFFSFWIIFCPFTPLPPPLPNNPVNQNFEKTPGGIIILHKCTINDNHMMHGFQDMNCTRPNVFVILGHFLPFYAPPPPPCLTAPKMKSSKKMKKTLEKSSFNRSVPTIMIICYTVPDIMLHGRCNSYFLFWAIFFFHFYPHNSLKNENLKQMNKTP